MRFLGICCLATGMLLFMPAMLSIVMADSPKHAIRGAICTLVFPLPMMFLGVVLIRQSERARLADKATQLNTDVQQQVRSENLMDDLRAKIMAFDLTRFTWPGWLLFFASFVFWFLQIILLTLLFPADDIADDPKWKVLVALTLVSSLSFFVVGAWLLRKFGVAICREQKTGRTKDDQNKRGRASF